MCRAARNPRLLLEIVLLQSSLPPGNVVLPPPVATLPQAPKPTPVTAKPVAVTPASVKEKPKETPAAASKSTTSVETTNVVPEITATVAPDAGADELWHQALEAIKKQYNTLYGVARMAQPTFDGQKLTLSFKFAFHQKRVNEAKNRKLLSDVIEKLYGQPVEIVCVVAEAESATKPDVSAISNIFGGAELLES